MTEQAVNPLTGLVNLRDLGGLATHDGQSTRTGVLYRSDAPHAGDRVPEEVGQWPPAAVIDLRDGGERRDEDHPMSDMTEVHHIPLLEALRDEIDDGAELGLADLYDHMVVRAPKKLVEVFRVTVEAGGPVLIHCAAGKDRTGVAAALLLGAAGVRRDAIVADYVLTDRNMLRVLQRLNLAPVTPPGVEEEDVAELISAPAEAIERVLDRLESHDGGAAGFLITHGATQEQVWTWQRRILGYAA